MQLKHYNIFYCNIIWSYQTKDPFDHRSLEYYAEAKGRGDELVTLTSLGQRDNSFKGPYQVSIYQLHLGLLFNLIYLFMLYAYHMNIIGA